MSQICHGQLSIFPNKKWTVKNLPKTGKLCQRGEISPNLITLLITLLVLCLAFLYNYLTLLQQGKDPLFLDLILNDINLNKTLEEASKIRKQLF